MTATIVATPLVGNSPPAMQLTLAGVVTATATVQRTDPSGAQYGVRGAEPITIVSGGAVVLDYEMPYAQACTYAVINPSGVTVASTVATLSVFQSWLIDPAFPSLSIPLYGVTLDNDVLPSGVVLQAIPGRRSPIPIGDGQRKSEQSTVGFSTLDGNGTGAAQAILAGTDTLLLQVAYPSSTATVWRYVSAGDATIARITQRFGDARRKFSLPYTVADRPAGTVQAEWTYADVAADYATYQDVLSKYLTYTGLVTGTEGT